MTMTDSDMTENMRVISWNVNGIRARWPRLTELLTCERPDVVCLQETRCSEWHFPRERLREMGYQSRHSPGSPAGGRRGDPGARGSPRSPTGQGSSTTSATSPRATGSSSPPRASRSARCTCPRAPRPASTATWASCAFLEAVARHACDEHSHPLLIAGDFNVAPTDEDVYEPAWFNDSYQTGEAERADLRAILDEGELVDVYRTLHPDERGYTCWEQREGHYGRDYGAAHRPDPRQRGPRPVRRQLRGQPHLPQGLSPLQPRAPGGGAAGRAGLRSLPRGTGAARRVAGAAHSGAAGRTDRSMSSPEGGHGPRSRFPAHQATAAQAATVPVVTRLLRPASCRLP